MQKNQWQQTWLRICVRGRKNRLHNNSKQHRTLWKRNNNTRYNSTIHNIGRWKHKINGQGTYTKDQLESGIQVNIAKTSTLTLTFSVTADELPEDTYERIIRNTAVVDGTSTNTEEVPEYTPNVEPSKSSEPVSGSEVIQGQKITYTITLDNSKGTAPGTVKVQDTIPTGTNTSRWKHKSRWSWNIFKRPIRSRL